MTPLFLQPHFTIEELAELWKIGRSTLYRAFEAESDVLKLGNVKGRGRKRITRRISQEVAERVYKRLCETGL